MKVYLNGLFWTSVQLAKAGSPVTEPDGEGATGIVELDVPDDGYLLTPIDIDHERTISLGDLESARLALSLAVFARADQHDGAFQEGLRLILEWVDFEIEKVQAPKEKRKDMKRPPLEWAGPQPAYLVVRLQYGLTINMGKHFDWAKYEFSKVQVGRAIPCEVGELEATIEALYKWVAQRVGVEKKRVIDGYKLPEKKKDLGF